MKKSNNGSDTEVTGNTKMTGRVTDTDAVTDEDTAELPTLDLAKVNEAKDTSDGATDSASVDRAATSIMDLRGEVEGLQERWETLNEKLTEANDHAASLEAKVAEKDKALAKLADDLDAMHKQGEALEAATVDRDASIASLELALTEREEEVAAVSQSQVAADGRVGVLEDRLDASKQEVEELRRSLQDAKSSEASLSAERETVLASQVSLRAKLQDLQDYVDGRREKWIEQQATLKSHKSSISSLEKALATSENRFDERNRTIESLQTRISELERESGEIEGRHKERGAAHLEAQGLLQGQVSEIERLKVELEQADGSAHKEELDALTALLAEKEESIRHLEVDISKFEAVKAHVEEQQQADRKTINELQQELAQLQAERDQLTGSLDDDRAKTLVLAEKLDAAERESSALLDENTTQKERISTLETELELRMEIIAGFNENSEKLNQLSRNMKAETEDHTETKLDISDRDLERVRYEKQAIDDSGFYDYATATQRHAMVALSGDSPTVYPISKPVTTIGRSESSDIRIKDNVISRMHALLQIDDNGVTIEDQGSKNGVLVNQSKKDRAALKHGDVVSIGKHDFRYVDLEQRRHVH